MTQITINLNIGHNYISFPGTSIDNFGTIFTISNIKQNIISFLKYDPILSPNWTLVNDSEFIEEGRGYLLDLSLPGTISYEGTEYNLTFEQLRSKLLRGWNLIGTGSNILYISDWCKIRDPITDFPVNQLEPSKSYWVDYYECIRPTTEPYLFISILGLGIAMISLFISMNSKSKFKEI